MLLRDFLNILYIHASQGMDRANYFLSLINILMNISDDSDNPFHNLKHDTIERYFYKNEISKHNVRIVLSKADKHNFAKYINALKYNTKTSIDEAFKRIIIDFNSDDDLGYACADLLHNILSNICLKEQSSCTSDTSSHTVVTPEITPPANIPPFKLFYKSFGFDERDPLSLISDNTVIDLNEATNKFSLDSASNVIYRFKTNYNFDSEYAPDFTRKVILNFDIDNISLVGFTSLKKWDRESSVDTFVYEGTRLCTAWFCVLSTQSEKPCVQFLMIGDVYE